MWLILTVAILYFALKPNRKSISLILLYNSVNADSVLMLQYEVHGYSNNVARECERRLSREKAQARLNHFQPEGFDPL
jgi:hypothetical protein